MNYEYDKTSTHRIYDESRKLHEETIDQWMSEIKKHVNEPDTVTKRGEKRNLSFIKPEPGRMWRIQDCCPCSYL
jgi:hypothetical protein